MYTAFLNNPSQHFDSFPHHHESTLCPVGASPPAYAKWLFDAVPYQNTSSIKDKVLFSTTEGRCDVFGCIGSESSQQRTKTAYRRTGLMGMRAYTVGQSCNCKRENVKVTSHCHVRIIDYVPTSSTYVLVFTRQTINP